MMCLHRMCSFLCAVLLTLEVVDRRIRREQAAASTTMRFNNNPITPHSAVSKITVADLGATRILVAKRCATSTASHEDAEMAKTASKLCAVLICSCCTLHTYSA